MGVSDLVIWLAFAAAQLADVWTTNRALRAPGLKEAHPLWRWVQRRMGRAWWIVPACWPERVWRWACGGRWHPSYLSGS